MSETDDLERRLKALDAERESIANRLEKLRLGSAAVSYTALPDFENHALRGYPASIVVPTTPVQKVELFLKLFRCRESVFPQTLGK